MADPVVMKYGDFDFSTIGPNPIFTINKETMRTGGQFSLGTKITVTLNGTILFQEIEGEAMGSLTAVTDRINTLKTAFAKDYDKFYLKCDNQDIYQGYPIVNSIDFTNHGQDNYVIAADYTISLSFNRLDNKDKDGYELAGAGYKQGDSGKDPQETDLTKYNLLSASDELSLEFYDNHDGGKLTYFSGTEEELKPMVVSVQRSLSAQGMGMSEHIEGEQENFNAEESARFWIMERIAEDETEGIKNLFCVEDFKLISRVRTVTSNKLDGSCSANVTYLLSQQDTDARYIESFDVNVEKSTDSPLIALTINGTIQGFSDVEFQTTTDVLDCNTPEAKQSAFDSATEGWELTKPKIYNRLKNFFDSDKLEAHGAGGPDEGRKLLKGDLHIQPLTESVGYNTQGGTVTYSRSYNNRVEFWNDKALVETISYTTNNATDIYASLTILGRANGPIFQNVGTTTAETKDLSIDAIVQPAAITNATVARDGNSAGDPTKEYDLLITQTESKMAEGANTVFFRSSDTESWEPYLGHYTRSVSWTVGEC